MDYKTTKQDFEYFKNECLRWRDLLSLKDWDIYFYHERYEKHDGCRACVVDFPSDRVAAIYFDPSWIMKPDKYTLSKTTFHEICELRFVEIRTLFNMKHELEKRNMEIHKIIGVLENTMFEKYYSISSTKRRVNNGNSKG